MFRFSTDRRTFLTVCAAGALVGTLAGCTDTPEFRGSDISDTHLGRDLAMVDASGQVRTLDDYKGKVLVVFFGFTHCPDVCPTAMAELAQTMQLLKDDAAKVQVLMITVDPERDSAATLNAYVKAFDPSFAGLSGSDQQLAKTAKSFKAYYSKEPGTTRDTYTMNHASSFYILDQQGEARVLISGNAAAADIASDISQLL